jgi:lipid A ethanolaminephosphotransferase
MNNLLFIHRQWEMTASRFVLLFSAFNTVLFNLAVYRYLNASLDLLSWSGISIVATITALIYLLNITALSLTTLIGPWLSKAFLVITALVNAAALYYMNTFQVVLDLTMIGNIFNTRVSESSELLYSATLYGHILLFGAVAAFFVLRTHVTKVNRLRVLVNFAVVAVAAVTLILINSSSWIWISAHRNMVRGKILPWSYVINTARFAAEKYETPAEITLLPGGEFADDSKTIVVLVIGESARAQNFSLYGYPKDTNPYLENMDVLTFDTTNSCATYTVAGIACILGAREDSSNEENLPSYLTRLGADVIWRTNNWGEANVNVAEYKTESDIVAECEPSTCDLDENLLIGLKERIESSDKEKIFVVLHAKGSHGPSYYARYSPESEVFTPVCRRDEVSKCVPEEFMNAYDNTIVYTDYFLHETIDLLKSFDDAQTMMVFISDHGESLGEGGMYLHGIPYMFAPEYQTTIPFIIWRSDAMIERQSVANQEIRQSGQFSQANIFHTVIGAFGVESEIYDSGLDVIKPEQRTSENSERDQTTANL